MKNLLLGSLLTIVLFLSIRLGQQPQQQHKQQTRDAMIQAIQVSNDRPVQPSPTPKQDNQQVTQRTGRNLNSSNLQKILEALGLFPKD